VRNYQARNFIGTMQPGDLFFFYHSSCLSQGSPASLASSASPTPTLPRWTLTALTTTPRPATIKTPGLPWMWPSSGHSPRC
jgi:hypothetical protein